MSAHDVIVVGAGIMGTSVAWALAKRGFRVVVLDQAALPNADGSSIGPTRLIRYPYGPMHGYARMVSDAFSAWEKLWLDLGERLIVERGLIIISDGEDPWVAGAEQSMAVMEVPHARLNANELRTRFPLLRVGDGEWGLTTPTGGILLTRRILEGMHAWLVEKGIGLHSNSPVDEVDADRSTVRLRSGETLEAGWIVTAAGPWTPRLIPELASVLTPSRQLDIDVTVPADRQAAWADMPILLDGVAWRSNGFYAVPPVDGHPLKVGDHRFTMTGDPDRNRTPVPSELEQIFELFAARVADVDGYAVAGGRSCFYTVAPDERFQLDQWGTHLALSGFSGHGFKFGPLLGEAMAMLVAGERDFSSVKVLFEGRNLADGEPERWSEAS
ncbi:MAG: FAD-dependent oxidoreductase [Geminicoccaceae bacterium]